MAELKPKNCADCIHESACQTWDGNMDAAGCAAYKTADEAAEWNGRDDT